jgi:hypothetical protein
MEIAGIVKDISEGSALLAPVKATCALIIRALELSRVSVKTSSVTVPSNTTTQGMHQNQLDLEEVTELIKKQKTQMETLAARLEGSNGTGSSTIQPKLEAYLE